MDTEVSLKIISSLSKTINHLYYIDMTDYSYTALGKGSEAVDAVIGRSGDARAAADAVCEYIVIPEQIEEMRAFSDLTTINERVKYKDVVSLQFQNNEGSWSEGSFIVSSRDNEGNCTGLLLAVRNIDDLKKKESETRYTLEKRLDAIKSLSKLYHASYFIDIENDLYYELLEDDSELNGYTAHSDPQAALNRIVADEIVSEYCDDLKEFADLSTLSGRMLDKEEISVRARLKTGDWLRIRFIEGSRNEDGNLKTVSFVARNINQEIAEENERNKQFQENQTKLEELSAEQEAQLEEITALNTQLENNQAELEASSAEQEAQLEEIQKLHNEVQGRLAIIESAMKVYFAAVYINLDSDSYITLNRMQRLEEIGYKQQGNASEMLNRLVSENIRSEFKDRMKEFTDLSTLNERLKKADVINMQYVGITSGWSQMYFIAGERKNNGSLLTVILAARTIHEEKEKELIHLEAIEEAVSKQRKQISEITKLNNSLTDYNKALSNAGYGMWHIILKDGCEPRMQVNDKMAELLDIDSEKLSEEEIYSSWYDRITENAIPSVQASVGEMVDGKFSENTYIWNHPIKGDIYVRCGGTAEQLEDGTNILSGYHADVTDIVLKEQKYKEEMAFQLKLAESLSEDYTNVFLINSSNGLAKAIAIEEEIGRRIEIKKAQKYSYELTCDKYLNKIIHSEDAGWMKKSMGLQNVIEKLKSNEDYTGNFRVNNDGNIHHYQFKYRKIKGTDYILLGFQNTDSQVEEEQRRNEELKLVNEKISEAYGMIYGLSEEYHTIWLVNKDNLKMRLIRSSGITTVQGAVKLAKKLVELDPTVDAYIENYIEPEDRDRAKIQMSSAEILHQLNENPNEIYTVNYLRRNDEGKVSYHQIAFANADTEDGKKQFVLGFRDIDKIVREEQKNREELKAAKEAAEAANRAKTSFLFNMSHDIRTPMNAIMGYANIMKRNQDNKEKWPDYLDKIIQSSDFLLGLINNILEMARIENGKTTLDETTGSISAFTDSLYSIFEDGMRQKNITFTRSVDVEHEYILCDLVKLREIFLNLVSNAQKYTPEGGSVDISIKELPSEKEGYALIETKVSDSGIGMSEEYIPHIFEDFSRERTSTESRVQGTGLGMPIVKKLVDLMGGIITVESTLGEGSIFTVTIYHRISQKASVKDKGNDSEIKADLRGKRILLAEDNEFNAEIAIEILKDTGAEIDCAEDGVVCVDKLEHAEEGYYDLILMDVQMPNMDGYKATRIIRNFRNPIKANIPIIAMTANAFEEDRKNALEAGMNGHISKPIRIPVLMETLTEILQSRTVMPVSINFEEDREYFDVHESRIYLEMKRSFAASVAPGGFFAYRAEQPEKLIYANEMACRIWGCSSFKELYEFTGGSFKGLIHPEDYERVETEIWNQIDNDGTDLDQVKYRIIKMDGTVSRVDDYGRLERDSEKGDIFYVFVSETPGGGEK